MTGIGTIAAATVGVPSGLGGSDTISNNVLLPERVANNIALAGEQQLAELAYHRNIVVTIPGNTRFYLVLGKPTAERSVASRAGSGRQSEPAEPGNGIAADSCCISLRSCSAV